MNTQSQCEYGNGGHTYLNLTHADGKETRQKQETMKGNEKGKFESDAVLLKQLWQEKTDIYIYVH